MPLTLDSVQMSAGGTTTPPAPDADETFSFGGHTVRLAVTLGQPERDHVTAVRIGGLRHPSLTLRKPMDLEIQWHEGGVSVADGQTGLWGEGDHLTDAIEDFQATLAELYQDLKEQGAQLGPGMQAEWAALQQWVTERP